MVYDLIPFQPGARARRRAALIERVAIGLALRRSARIVCASESTRRDLLSRYPEVQPKSAVVQLAADERFSRLHSEGELEEVRRRYGLSRPFVLSVGTLEPRKNLVRTVDAYTNLPDDLRERYCLVVVGPRGWEYDEIAARIEAHPDEVSVLGHVPDDDLAALYQACEVFCYPSLYEGFGLPLLEALAAGAPAVTSDVSSLPEVGGDAVWYVGPRDTGAIRAALERLLRSPDERRALSERARTRAARFSWERVTAEILVQLTEAAGAAASTRS
jgi:glycosyltransferase involved in cell wall biosynthesis